MAARTRASRALLSFKPCRQTRKPHARAFSGARATSNNASPYSPSSFNRPLRSPLGTPPPAVESNIDYLPRPPPRESVPRSERSVQLPSFVRNRQKKAPPPPAHAKLNFTNWVRWMMGLEVKAPPKIPPSIHVMNNPFKTKKHWPPDFRKLHPKQQFHFEKTFRRRALLKWARPNFHKKVKRLQRSLMILVLVYAVFLAEPEGGTPFDGFRIWFFCKIRSFGLSPETAAQAEEYERQLRAKRDQNLLDKRRIEEAIWDARNKK